MYGDKCVHGADGRSLDIDMEPPELLADLRRPPAGSLPLELNNQLLDLKGQLVRLPVGPPTAIGQSIEAAVLVALEDLVAALARDIELPAKRHLFLIRRLR
jgi:hypothetical protein